MGDPLKNRSTIDIRTTRDRICFQRLQSLPGVIETALKRIAEGDSAAEVAQYLHRIHPDIAEETFQQWVQTLVTQTHEPDENKRPAHRQMGAVEGSKATANEKSRIVEESSDLSREVAAVAKEFSDISGMQMLKYSWVMQQSRVDSMMDLEQSKGIISPGGHKEIAELLRIAVSAMKYEVKNAAKNRDDSGVETNSEVNGRCQKVTDPNCVNPNLLKRLRVKIAEINSDLQASEACMWYPPTEDHK